MRPSTCSKCGSTTTRSPGALHLAFTERALLADEMGLGKTVQAIAACTLLRQLRGISRVLVVSPHLSRPSGTIRLPSSRIFLQRSSREMPSSAAGPMARGPSSLLPTMNRSAPTGDTIGEYLAPDVVVLDEAQRIKNWQTKTADAVKKLRSRYAFVLTGTPIENRIDELYSIVQFLDPDLLGPLFRFNRDYYVLDDRGRPTGFRNLDRALREGCDHHVAPPQGRRRGPASAAHQQDPHGADDRRSVARA